MLFDNRRSQISFISWVFVMLTAGCHNAPENNLPVAPASASASVAAQVATATAAATGPSWHWMNPQPQGNGLRVVLATPACGVLALGDQSTILRSNDDGVTWTTRQLADRWRFKAAAISGTSLYILGDTSDANVLLAIASCGSGDAKTVKTFDPKTDGAANGVAVDLSGRIYVSTVAHAHGRMWCSQEQGFNLSVCDDQPAVPFYGVFTDKNGHILVAGGYRGAAGGVVRASSDHGTTWKSLGQHLGSIVYGIGGDLDGKHLVATGSGEIYTSDDGGSTWRASPALTMGGGSMMLGTGDAPYVPNDFASWVFVSPLTGTFLVTSGGTMRGSLLQSPPNVQTTDAGVDAAVATPGGHWIGVGDSGLVKRSIDDGKTWTTISKDVLTEGDHFVSLAADAHSVFVLRKTRFLRSDDGGKSFVTLAEVDVPELPISPRDFISFAVDDSLVLMPRPTARSIGRSTDRGATFSETPIRLVGAQNVTHVWSGSAHQFFASGKSGALFRSQDDGATFTPLDLASHDDLAAGYAHDHEIVLSGTSAAATGHVFHSTDDGKTWTTTPLDLEPFGIGVAGADIYVVGRYGKVAHSKDAGKTWAMATDLDCGDVTGLVTQRARIDLACGDGLLFTSTDRAATFQKTPIAADVELLFSDGATGLLATSARGFPQLLHFY